MNRNLALANRLREVFLDGHWIANTNYKTQLLAANWQQATQKIQQLNSIAALTFHINYYLEGLLKAFECGRLDIRDRYSFELPLLAEETAWQALVTAFLRNAEKFVLHIQNLPDSAFDEPFIDEKYGSLQRNVEGIIEHSYYHLGQIVLIKKLILGIVVLE